MIRNISVGIDIGSTKTRVVVGEFLKGEKNPKIIGVGESETKGLNNGYVLHFEEVLESVKNAILNAEKTSGIKIKRAFVSISGTSLRSNILSGNTIVSKADNEVTHLDIKKAVENSKNNFNLDNKKIIDIYPIYFRLDGKEIFGKIEGMYGNKLEIKSVCITFSQQHLNDLLDIMAELNIEVIDVIPSVVAGSYMTLSERQKIVGSALINIGSEVSSMGVFENGSLVSLHSFPIGGNNITNDIALGLKIPIEEAESLKVGNTVSEYPKRKLEEIIEARLFDILEEIEKHLKKIKRTELLPAGIVWIGGGSNINNLKELSTKALKLHSSIGTTEMFGKDTNKNKLKDPSWFVALGLIMKEKDKESYSEGSFANTIKDLKNILKSGLKQLLP